MKKTKAIILAAGGGTRMKSKTAKVIHKILGKTLVQYVIESAREAGAEEICVVVGHQKEEVMTSIGDGVTFVTQEELLGTGHAVMQAGDFIEDEGQVLVLFGDTPLITSETLKAMVDHTHKSGSQVTVLSTLVDEPAGYGRIIRDIDQNFLKSVEDKDASESELLSHEINSGMYCFDSAALKASLGQLSNKNAQGEYYLPDTLEIIMADGGKAQALVTSKSDEILGINTKVQLAEAAEIIKMRINNQHMLNGVTLINPNQTYISKDAIIEQDATIYPNTFIEGNSKVGQDSVIGPNSRLVDSVIGSASKVEQSTVLQSRIGDDTTVGPYAYIRPNSDIGLSETVKYTHTRIM